MEKGYPISKFGEGSLKELNGYCVNETIGLEERWKLEKLVRNKSIDSLEKLRDSIESENSGLFRCLRERIELCLYDPGFRSGRLEERFRSCRSRLGRDDVGGLNELKKVDERDCMKFRDFVLKGMKSTDFQKCLSDKVNPSDRVVS